MESGAVLQIFKAASSSKILLGELWECSQNSNRCGYHYLLFGAIIESELKLNRDIYEVMRILGSSMLVKDNIKDLFSHAEYDILYKNDGQLELDFTS